MPPPNPQRRDRIADAAIKVLAEEGSRRLTHRAVDAAAEVPPGTTSRYFRSRDALIDGAVDRITRSVDERVKAHVADPLDRSGLEDALVAVLGQLAAEDRGHPLALFELHLEAARNPRLRRMLGEALTGRRDLIRRQCAAAGVAITSDDALRLETAVLGILFAALTTGIPSDISRPTRAAVRSTLEPYLSGHGS